MLNFDFGIFNIGGKRRRDEKSNIYRGVFSGGLL